MSCQPLASPNSVSHRSPWWQETPEVVQSVTYFSVGAFQSNHTSTEWDVMLSGCKWPWMCSSLWSPLLAPYAPAKIRGTAELKQQPPSGVIWLCNKHLQSYYQKILSCSVWLFNTRAPRKKIKDPGLPMGDAASYHWCGGGGASQIHMWTGAQVAEAGNVWWFLHWGCRGRYYLPPENFLSWRKVRNLGAQIGSPKVNKGNYLLFFF